LMPIAVCLMRSSPRPGAATSTDSHERTSGPPAA
jgi:hypothetical protein